ncbi:hypothetical protein [Parasitella parasitica]|uniref:Chitosanase n=1 Tax=Parasitella parasitica TaxID=35722 RepID=A0A0B7N0E7_9FUNG|nr:hypothetical protein [Parasitella parasitica]
MVQIVKHNGANTLATSTMAATSKFCSGDTFGVKKSICDKFEFNKISNAGQCTDSKKKAKGEFSGVKLANCTTFYDISGLPDQTMDPKASKMAELITNVFENGDTKMGYAAVEKLGDCRGFTCGYIGFTTGTNDAYAVVKEYVKRQPQASMKKYLGELARLSNFTFGDPERDNTDKLGGFDAAWKKTTCDDPVFVQTQLDVGQSMYLKPALKYAASVGVKSNLGKAIFYDTIVQHGWQYVEPYINLPRILHLTGARKEGESEKDYLTRFVTTRRQLVCCYPGGVWNDSADRMEDLQTLVDEWSTTKDLKGTITLKGYGVKITGKESITADTKRCKSSRKSTKSAKSISLPIPNVCPKKE